MLRGVLAALLILAATLLGTLPVGAQAIERKSANVLKVSPVRTDIEVRPGSRKVVQVTISNLSDAPVRVTPVANDFIAGDERGTPALILDETQSAPTHSLKRFMSPLSAVTIPAKGSKTVNVVVTVPADAQAGGYFGSIRFMPTDPADGGQVNLSPSVASLILLKVPGAIVEKVKLTDFEVQKKGSSGIYFKNPDGLDLMFRFENRGNVQVAPLGSIQVRQGKNVIYEHAFNSETPHDSILPDSARRWEVPLKDVGAFGFFTVTSTFTYGDKNQTIETKKSFWVVPSGVIIGGAAVVVAAIAGGIAAIVLAARRVRRGRRRPTFGAGRKYSGPSKRFGR